MKIHKSITSVCALLVIVSAASGCGSSSSHEANRAERQKIIDSFEKKLGELDVKIQEGEAKLARVEGEAKVKLNEELVSLRQKQASAKDSLGQMKQSIADHASDAWQKSKDTFDGAWHDVTSKLQTWLDAIK
jgi:hypothetical protein